jgi:hypothetical protein
LPRGGYSAWTGVNKNKLNANYGYNYNSNEVKGKILTEGELRIKASSAITGRTKNKTYTDKLYNGGHVLGVTPDESSRNGIAIVGSNGRMQVY